MDPVRVRPYYQPIMTITDGSIYGYEVLGRYVDPSGNAVSLGPYFHDDSVSLAEKIDLSRLIRTKSFDAAVARGIFTRLFVNIKPSWVWRYYGSNDDLPTLSMLDSCGLSGESIVIEITEDEFSGDIRELSKMLARYRERGCKIAVDDFNFNFTERLIHLRPDIVKLDMALVKNIARSKEYRSLIEYIASFARDFGITVLFEGVEEQRELESAIESGAELIQGYLISEAVSDFIPADSFQKHLATTLKNVVERNWKDYRGLMAIESAINKVLTGLIQEGGSVEHLDLFIEGLLESLPKGFFRVYACNGYGYQLSSNYERSENGFATRPEYKGKNWSWRPYFLNNLVRIQQYGRGIMSSPYKDQETRKETVTFSYPLSRDLFLFVDFELTDTG